jgi:hypothetical protein
VAAIYRLGKVEGFRGIVGLYYPGNVMVDDLELMGVPHVTSKGCTVQSLPAKGRDTWSPSSFRALSLCLSFAAQRNMVASFISCISTLLYRLIPRRIGKYSYNKKAIPDARHACKLAQRVSLRVSKVLPLILIF